MMRRKKFHLLLVFAQLLLVAVTGQQGFLSIDCGKPAGDNYTDANIGIQYVSDYGYVDTGVNYKIQDSYRSLGVSSQALDLRSFPNGTRNCYTLPVTNGNRYLTRLYFMYGNYDGENRLPEFDIYMDMFFWGTTSIANASIDYYLEMVLAARANYMSVCLVDTGKGTPFISYIDLRLLPDNIYLEANASQALASFIRIDFGAEIDSSLIRYKSDDYDRMWVPYTLKDWTKLKLPSTSEVDVRGNYEPPKFVMGTAATPSNGTTLSINISPSTLSPPPQYYIFMYFAEVELLTTNQSRIFNISLNGENFYSPFQPPYRSLITIGTRSPQYHAKLDFSIYQAEGSTLPPIINAMEIYIVKQPIASGTDAGDIDAIMGIKRYYSLVERNWMGDPCSPRSYLWDGLNCTYPDKNASRIISLTLSSFGLTGEIAPSIGDLVELKHLDLSMNNLTGGIPDFLANLANLALLNLSGNNFSGGVPKSLEDRAKSGTLTLSVDIKQNHTTETSGGDKKKSNNIWKVIVAVVAVLVLAGVLAFLFVVIVKSRRNKGKDSTTEQNPGIPPESRISKRGGGSFRIPSFRAESRQFTFSELTQITNNFNKVIGRGGFGIVYYGELENGKPVAVKMLSQSSNQGSREFKAEAQLLTRIYHKNLVPLVGYCKDKEHMLLVYEYMAQGSLADRLSDNNELSNNVSWKERLRIGFEAAQGLDYLHRGCKPTIIHRDIKSSNILLSGDLEAKIADFGLSRIFVDNEKHDFVSTAVMGTPGYLDPEYSTTSKLNEKSDVYSFGVVLLELITGKPAIIRRPNMINIVNWVEPLLASGDLDQIVDAKFNGDYDPNSVWKALEVAMACVAQFAVQRPTMNDVATLLKDSLELELIRGKKYDSFQSSNNSTGIHEIFPTGMTSTFAPLAR